MKKNKTPKFLKGLKVEMTQEIDLNDTLRKALDKYTVKDLLEYIFFVTINNGLMYGMSMMRILANEKDVENVRAMIILKYILENWNNKKFMKNAGVSFEKAMERAEKKAKEKEKI